MHRPEPLPRLELTNRPCRRDAVEPRHLDVHEDAGEFAAGGLVAGNGERAVGGGGEGEVLFAEVCGEEVAVDGVVIDHEVGCDV